MIVILSFIALKAAKTFIKRRKSRHRELLLERYSDYDLEDDKEDDETITRQFRNSTLSIA